MDCPEASGHPSYPKSAEPEGRGPPPVRVHGRVRDPLEGWVREDGCLAGALGFQYAPVDGAGLVLKLAQSPAPEPAEFPEQPGPQTLITEHGELPEQPNESRPQTGQHRTSGLHESPP